MVGAALSLAFFLSGAAGLIFQVVWFHRAGLVFGSSIASVTVVLSAFMAGLALGNALAVRRPLVSRRPLRSYAFLELVVAASGVAVTLALPLATRLLAGLADVVATPWALEVVRFVGAFIMLLPPAVAMGATLPVVVTALVRHGESYGRSLGRMYGWNTTGALVGVLAADIVLIRGMGVRNTAFVAVALNLSAAMLAWWCRPEPDSSGNVQTRIVAGNPSNASRHIAIRLPWMAAASGAILLALEVVWFRFLTLFVLSTTLAASLMVAAVLAGIAVGGFAGAWWLRRDRPAVHALPWLASAAMAVTVGTYAAFSLTTSGTQVEDWSRVLWFAVVLTAPTAAISGTFFTVLGDAFKNQFGSAIQATGLLALSNTAGALLGPPISAFVLLPLVGIERALLMLALAYGVVAWLAVSAGRTANGTPRKAAAAAVVVALMTLAAFPYGIAERRYFPRAASAYAADGSVVLRTSEGPSETIFLMGQRLFGEPVYHRLVTNGFSMTGTGIPGQRYMRAFAYLPMLLHRDPIEHALLICYGVGVTASAVLQIPGLTSLDVAEISSDVVAMSDAIYSDAEHPLKDARTRLHLEDGRFYLGATEGRFDLITGEPPPPRTPGAVNIYTEEYFRLLRDHLNPGGMVTYWLPVARPNPGTDIDTVIRAFCNVFDDCSLWNATPFDFMLLGTRGASGPVEESAFARPWQTPGLATSLREIGFERPEQIGATFLGDADYLATLTAGVPPLTDDYPQRLRPSARPSLSDPRYGTSSEVRARYQQVLDTDRARAAFQSSAFIDRFFPPELQEKSLPYFRFQRVVNDALWDGGRPLAHIEDLHALLTQTTLRTLPLWVMGTDDVKVRIAETHGDDSAAIRFARGLRALSARDYDAAWRFFQAAQADGLNTPSLEPLLAYSAARRGSNEADVLLARARPSTADEQHFWRWLRTFREGGG